MKHLPHTPEPEQLEAVSPRKALAGSLAPSSPRKRRAPDLHLSSDDDGQQPTVNMNGMRVSTKRPAPRVTDTDDDCEVDTPEEEDDIVFVSTNQPEQSPRTPPAFVSLAAPKQSWLAKIKQAPAPKRQIATSSGVRATGPKVRHRLAKR